MESAQKSLPKTFPPRNKVSNNDNIVQIVSIQNVSAQNVSTHKVNNIDTRPKSLRPKSFQNKMFFFLYLSIKLTQACLVIFIYTTLI